MTEELKKAITNRKVADVPQWSIAKMLGCSQTDVSFIERGMKPGELADKYIKLMTEKTTEDLKNDHDQMVHTLSETERQNLSGKVNVDSAVMLDKNDRAELIKLRLSRGLFSYKDAADKTGVGAGTVSKIENGRPVGTYIFNRYKLTLTRMPEVGSKAFQSKLGTLLYPPTDSKPVSPQLPLLFKPPEVKKVEAAAPPEPKKVETQLVAGKFVPKGTNVLDGIECDGKTLYTFTAVPGGIWVASVGTFKLGK